MVKKNHEEHKEEKQTKNTKDQPGKQKLINTGFTYSIDGNNFSNTTGVFTDLGAASVTSVQIKNSDGCFSAATSCANLVSECAGKLVEKKTNSAAATEEVNSLKANLTQTISEETTIKAYPNPFNDRVKFVVNVPKAGNGALEVYNIMGQKIQTVYQGFLPAGTNNFDLYLPGKKSSNLIYKLSMGTKQITGKISQLTGY